MKDKLIRCLIGIATLAAAYGASTTVAGARNSESGAHPPLIVQRFDADGDGLVSADEFPGDEDQFSELDIDGDGYLDEVESADRPPRGGPGPADIMAEFDEDGDGLLSATEFPGPEDHFTAMDADQDGYLSAEELQAGRPGPPRGGRSGFDKDHTDQDGIVSQEEFTGPEAMFTDLDADGDGYITREEIREAGIAGPKR